MEYTTFLSGHSDNRQTQSAKILLKATKWECHLRVAMPMNYAIYQKKKQLNFWPSRLENGKSDNHLLEENILQIRW